MTSSCGTQILIWWWRQCRQRWWYGSRSHSGNVLLFCYDIHYNIVIMGAMASQITSLTIVYSTVYSGADQRKHRSSASLAFVRGIHRSPVNSLHKGPVTRKMFPFDDVIMNDISRPQPVRLLSMDKWWHPIEKPWYVITYPCPRCWLLVQNSSYANAISNQKKIIS